MRPSRYLRSAYARSERVLLENSAIPGSDSILRLIEQSRLRFAQWKPAVVDYASRPHVAWSLRFLGKKGQKLSLRLSERTLLAQDSQLGLEDIAEKFGDRDLLNRLQHLKTAVHSANEALSNELVEQISTQTLLTLARILALRHDSSLEDKQLAFSLYMSTLQHFGVNEFNYDPQRGETKQDAPILVGLALDMKERNTAQDLLGELDIREPFRSSLRCDALHPKTIDSPGFDKWLDALRSTSEMSDLSIKRETDAESVSFNQIDAPVSRTTSGPLVSIIMTAFRPQPQDIQHSIRSLINQTHQDLEVLIVDDGSGAEWTKVFQDVASLDDRIRLISLDRNSGTYVARNFALESAGGDFITFQDSDDWSHPTRIERQLQMFSVDGQGNVAATHCRSVRLTENLTFHFRFIPPKRLNFSSLMMPRATFDKLGFFLPVRTGADTEYVVRASHAFPGAVVGIPASPNNAEIPVLTCVRVGRQSLSSADFGVGYTRKNRLDFASAYRMWHQQLARTRAWHFPAASGLPFDLD